MCSDDIASTVIATTTQSEEKRDEVKKPQRVEKKKKDKHERKSFSKRKDDDSEDEWSEKQRRIRKLADILVQKEYPQLQAAKCVIATHKKFRHRLRDYKKVKVPRLRDGKIVEKTKEIEIMSEPLQELKIAVLDRARDYDDDAYEMKERIKWEIRRREGEMDHDEQLMEMNDNNFPYPKDVEWEAEDILHKEYPNLSVVEKIIKAHKKNPSRLHQVAKGRVGKKGSIPVKVYRTKQSEPRALLKTKILREAQIYKGYTELRKQVLKDKLMNQLLA